MIFNIIYFDFSIHPWNPAVIIQKFKRFAESLLKITTFDLEKSLNNSVSTEEEPYLSPTIQNDFVSSSSEIYHLPDQQSSPSISDQSLSTSGKDSESFSSIPSGDVAVVSEIISPNQFSIQRKKMDSVFKCKLIQHVKRANCLSAPRIRSLVFVQVADDQDWLRGRIENIHTDGYFTIYFIDLGTTQKLYCPK